MKTTKNYIQLNSTMALYYDATTCSFTDISPMGCWFIGFYIISLLFCFTLLYFTLRHFTLSFRAALTLHYHDDSITQSVSLLSFCTSYPILSRSCVYDSSSSYHIASHYIATRNSNTHGVGSPHLAVTE